MMHSPNPHRSFYNIYLLTVFFPGRVLFPFREHGSGGVGIPVFLSTTSITVSIDISSRAPSPPTDFHHMFGPTVRPTHFLNWIRTTSFPRFIVTLGKIYTDIIHSSRVQSRDACSELLRNYRAWRVLMR